MKIKSRKVAVIGVGNVGSHVAFSLVTRGIADELVLIDIKEDKVKSEMLDLKDSLANLNSNVIIKIQDYSDKILEVNKKISEIKKILLSCNTTKQLFDLVPEFEKYIEIDKTLNLPVPMEMIKGVKNTLSSMKGE